MNSISKLEKNSNYLKVIWDDGEESQFNYLWLRDNCQTAHDKDSKHRMFNSGNSVLVFIEVQTGSYFGEDDIVRLEDDYKRI